MALIDAVFADRPGMTPQDVERQRQLAKALLAESTGTEPLQHPLQAVAKMLSAGVGAYRDSKASKGEKAGMDYRRQQIGKALFGSAAPAPTAGGTPSSLPATAAGAQMGATNPAPDVSKNGGTFSPFIDTVRAGGLTNPYGLAAVAATGRAESGWSPQNAARSWSDPSESGQAGSAGGILSWRADRLANLQRYAASKGEQGNGSPQTQAEYFMREDPGLIAKLNAAKSADEAQSLMNNAWKFAGYNRPGGEAARRLGYATAYLPRFQGGAETASLDPAAGMAPAAAAIETQAQTPYRDPLIVQSPAATALAAQEMQAPTAPNRQPLAPQLPPPINVSTPVVTPENVQLAQALTGGQAQAAPGISPQVIQQLLGDPWTADMGEKLVGTYLDNQMQQQQAQREAAMKQAERQAQWAREDARNAVLDGRADRDYNFQREKFGAEQQNATMTGDIREYEFAKQQGYAGSFTDYQRDMKKAGAQNINMGTIPPGFQLVTDPVTNAQRMEPIPGSPVSNANDKSAESRETATSVITTAAQRAREAMAGATFPTDGTVGSFLSKMPGTAAAEVRRQVAVLKSNATIENLNAMRRESPTGGALGSVTQEENAMLAAKAGALDPDSPNFPRDLDDYERSLLRTIHGKEAGDAIYAQTRAVAPQPDAQTGAPEGVDPSIWEAMTPEERALWQN